MKETCSDNSVSDKQEWSMHATQLHNGNSKQTLLCFCAGTATFSSLISEMSCLRVVAFYIVRLGGRAGRCSYQTSGYLWRPQSLQTTATACRDIPASPHQAKCTQPEWMPNSSPDEPEPGFGKTGSSERRHYLLEPS